LCRQIKGSNSQIEDQNAEALRAIRTNSPEIMKILFAAKDGFKYNRTFILSEGLKAIGVDVQFYKIPERQAKYGQRLRDFSLSADAVFVPPFRHRDLAFVKKYAKAPVVFDPLISRYLTKVVDYGQYYKAPQKWLIDFRDFRNCDLLIADTQSHLDYFTKSFLLPANLPKTVIPVGVNTDEYKAQYPKSGADLNLGFYGTMVPLQGVLKIVEALALLKGEKGLNYSIFGTGYQYEAARELTRSKMLSTNIFKGWVSYENLASELSQIDLGLGIFGSSKKSDLVVPNKIFHYAALGKGIITKDSPAMREMFEHQKNIYTLSGGPEDLASAILHFRDNRENLIRIAQNARQNIEEHYSHKAVANKLVEAISRL